MDFEDFINDFMKKPEETPPPDLVIRVPEAILNGDCSLATFSAYVGSLTEEDCKNLHLLDYMRLMKRIKQMASYTLTPAELSALKIEPLPEDHK